MEHTKTLAQADAYRTFAICFYEPEAEWLAPENLFSQLKHILKMSLPPIVPNIEQLEQAFQQYSIEELTVEYARLFVGPFKLEAPPYGSLYLETEGKVMGDTTMAVKNMYRQYGLEIAEDFKELPDHIAVELEFMYYLGYQASVNGNRETYIQAQRTFLKQYLAPFVFPFCEQIKTNTTNEFYRQLAETLSQFIRFQLS
ncbi:MAG: molecular chaperone TorD [Gemmatimonadetes bacterium]|nr:MAG: molecular chaperone TorD [Gemmatimonadota bacterium]